VSAIVEGLRSEYHRQLEEIDSALSRMIVLVEEAISAASTALLSADDDAAEAVAVRREEIEELHRSVESLVVRQLVRQAPVARDLRFLIAVLRIIPELELGAALAGDIARRGTMHIGPELPPRIRGLVNELFEHALDMWRQAEDGYRDRAPEVRDRLETEDEEIDELHASLSAELASGLLRAPVLVEMALIARFLERLGDHAVEVGRWVESFSSAERRPEGD
jgi:phosphate transport system protein